MGIYENCVQWKGGEQGIAVHCFPLFPVTQKLRDSLNCMFKTKHFSNITHNLIVKFLATKVINEL